jgi:hypothetical protein
MLKKAARLLLNGCLLCVSASSFAGTMGAPPPMPMIEVHPWSVTASLGYTSYEYGTHGEGQTPVGRLAIGKALCDFGASSFGLELGVQNGNSMHLFIPQATLDVLGGLPVSATITPLLDLLATLRISVSPTSTVFIDLKGGAAYRRMYIMDRDTVNNKYQFAGEFQGGVGMPITDSSTISILYQGVYGGSLGFTLNADALTGAVSNIPVQNGVLISLNITL